MSEETVRQRAEAAAEASDCRCCRCFLQLTRGWGRARSFHRPVTHTRRHRNLPAWRSGSEVQCSAARRSGRLAGCWLQPAETLSGLLQKQPSPRLTRREVSGQSIELKMSNGEWTSETSGRAKGSRRRGAGVQRQKERASRQSEGQSEGRRSGGDSSSSAIRVRNRTLRTLVGD